MKQLDNIIEIRYIPIKELCYIEYSYATIYLYKPEELKLFEYYLYHDGRSKMFIYSYVNRNGQLHTLSYANLVPFQKYVEEYFAEILMEEIL